MARTPEPLPIDAHVDAIVGAIRRARAVVVTAEPGAGKTTRVPPALVADGPVLLLQPRRAAARALAGRIADERGWTVGREIGWQIRFDRRFGADTRLLVATEGVLTARLQRDPLLSAFRTIVIDEFHERSVYADVALALAKQAWRARDDLRLAVMSATLDAEPVAAFLDSCPIVAVPGRVHAIAIGYAPGRTVADAAVAALAATTGDVLCFLAGAGEIRQTVDELQSRRAIGEVAVVPLHGSLDAAAQDAALRPAARRRIVVSTNLAETSVTVPGVTAVVDSGWHKVARYDADRAIDSLALERIPQDSADQRAGRAGRTAPGRVWRLWDPRDRLRPHREPEIHRIDLSATMLDVLAWGGDPRTLDWFEPPRDEAIDAALALLERLGAVAGGRLTPIGDELKRLPLPPRLARMLVAANGARAMARVGALLSERHYVAPHAPSTSSDLLSALDAWASVSPHVANAAHQIEQLAAAVLGGPSDPQMNDVDFRRAVLAGYPDRVGQRRTPGMPRVLLMSGAGATIGAESGVREGEFLVAIDVQASIKPGDPDARIRLASRVDREWLAPTSSEIVHRVDRDSGRVKAAVVERYGALRLSERPASPDPHVTAQLLADAWLERGPGAADQRLLRRLHFAGHEIDLASLVRCAAEGARSLDEVQLARALPAEAFRLLDREAPDAIVVPTGRAVRLDYRDDGSVMASVKLQELFGLAETPRIGARREPVLLALAAPNGRPVQVTRDLRSFWNTTYPEVRKELRGRYPKHPWPEDPWSATPTKGTTKRR